MFELTAEYELDLAQPSWCSGQDTVAKQSDLQMHGTLLLRYLTYVETLAPLWSRSFWHEHVVPSLQHADQGTSLTFNYFHSFDIHHQELLVMV